MTDAKKKVRKSTKKAVLRRKVYKAIGMEKALDEPEVVIPKKKDGRAKVSEEVYNQILADIADGFSMRKACEKNGLAKQSFQEKLRRDEDFTAQYMRARQEAGDSCMDKIDDIEEMLKAGKIDSSSANVLIQTEKWKAQKYYPKMYGDTMRTQLIDDEGKSINPFAEFYKAVCDKKDYTPEK